MNVHASVYVYAIKKNKDTICRMLYHKRKH